MTGFAVPRMSQQKVLMIGIVIALILRGAFIAVGAPLIENLSWIFYVFGALLLVLDYRQAFAHRDRKSVVEGKSVPVRVHPGGRRMITTNKKNVWWRIRTVK